MKRQYDIGVRQQQYRKGQWVLYYNPRSGVDITGGSRSGSESSHLILQDLQCDFVLIYFQF